MPFPRCVPVPLLSPPVAHVRSDNLLKLHSEGPRGGALLWAHTRSTQMPPLFGAGGTGVPAPHVPLGCPQHPCGIQSHVPSAVPWRWGDPSLAVGLQALEEDLGGSFGLSLPFWGILAAGMPGLSLSVPQPSPRCVAATASGSHVCWKPPRSPGPAAPSTRRCHQPRPRLAGLEQPAAP